MGVVIPQLNSQIRAGRTPAAQTATQSDIPYRDIGLEDTVVDAMKSMGGAVLKAKESRDTGMANATTNEFSRRMNAWYMKATESKDYKGYDAENFMPDMRKYARDTLEDLKLNGFVRQDGSRVAALSEDIFNNKFLPSADSMLVRMDSNAMEYAFRETAIAEQNDYNNNISRLLKTLATAEDPITQDSVSGELSSLSSAFYGGRLSEEALGSTVVKYMNTGLTTRAANIVIQDPAKAMNEFNSNPNYTKYGVSLVKNRQDAVEAMAIIAGTNEAMESLGLQTVPQNWTDQPLPATSELRNAYPFSAAGLMTTDEYLKYSIKKAETAVAKKATISDEVRKQRNSKVTEIYSDFGKAETQEDVNKLVEREAVHTDKYGAHILSGITMITDNANIAQSNSDFVDRYTTRDGDFDETVARQEADILAAAKGIAFDSVESRRKFEDGYIIGLSNEYAARKEAAEIEAAGAENSAKALSDFYEKLNSSSAMTTPQEIAAIGMNARDSAAALDALITKARTKDAAETIARNEGGTFDVYNLAAEQWVKFDNPSKYGEDGKVSDPENRQKFVSRFVELYIRKHSSDKPNAQELEQLSIEAYNTYKKEPMYDEVSKFTLKLRNKAAESYQKLDVATFEEKDRLRDFLETGHESYSSKRLQARSEIVGKTDNIISALDPNLALAIAEGAPEYYAYYLGFESDREEELWDSLVEIYNKADYNSKETLVDFIVSGNNSALLRVLKAKGMI